MMINLIKVFLKILKILVTINSKVNKPVETMRILKYLINMCLITYFRKDNVSLLIIVLYWLTVKTEV
jgi:hypothetical protein